MNAWNVILRWADALAAALARGALIHATLACGRAADGQPSDQPVRR